MSLTVAGGTRAAVLSVGDELLLGDLTDTNATWISGRLRARGVTVAHHLAVGDEVGAIVDALRWLADRCELVIVGGGLGPTADDRTREAVAAALDVELELREELEEAILARFVALGRPMAPSNRRQAMVPAGAVAAEPAGTAPAFAVDLPVGDRQVRIVALPGVPWELAELWDRFVEPQLAGLVPAAATVTRVVHVAGRGESDVAALVEPLVAADGDVTLAFLAKQHGVQVRLTATAEDRTAAWRRAQPAVDRVVAALGDAVAGLDDEDLAATVVRLLVARGERVATAESATGGAIAARLARVPGASAALVGGLVVYGDGAKAALAGLDPALVAAAGPVSEPTTRALAVAARERSGADWGLAVTGVAGPEPVGALPVGTVHWALAGPDGACEADGRRLPGDRGAIIDRLGSAALDLLRRRLVTG